MDRIEKQMSGRTAHEWIRHYLAQAMQRLLGKPK